MNEGESQEESAGRQRRSQRLRPQVSYKEVEDDADYVRTEIDAKKMTELLTTRDYITLNSTVAPGKLTTEMLRENGFREPIVVRPEGGIENTRKVLGIQLPDFELTVDSIVDTIGVNYPVNIIDVASQMAGPDWNLGQWRDYYKRPIEQRGRLLNVVSLELAGSPLASMVAPPKAVRDIELIGQVWPKEDLGKPEVLLYGLMGVEGCITDFHIDFGGSSVWYHVISGKKVFLLVPPTADNIDQFEKWSSCSAQFSTFYGDLADGVMRVELEAGCTMLIPAGWPHAVATPEDSVVVGGNFVHGLDMGHQLAVWRLEQRLKVHDQFRFPKYKTLMQHTATHYLRILQRMERNGYKNTGLGKQLLKWELEGLQPLVDMLRTWSRSQKVDAPNLPVDSAGVAQALQMQINKYELANRQDGATSCGDIGRLICQKCRSNQTPQTNCKHRSKLTGARKLTKASKRNGGSAKKSGSGGPPPEFLYFGGCGLDGKARKIRKMNDILHKGPKRLHSLGTLRSWRDSILSRAAADTTPNRTVAEVTPADGIATAKEAEKDGGTSGSKQCVRGGAERRDREEPEPASPGRCKRLKRLGCSGEEMSTNGGGEESSTNKDDEVVLTRNPQNASDSGGGAERVHDGGDEGSRDPLFGFQDELMVAEGRSPGRPEGGRNSEQPSNVDGNNDEEDDNNERTDCVKKNAVGGVRWGHRTTRVSKSKPVFRRKSAQKQPPPQHCSLEETPKKRKQQEGASPEEWKKRHALGVGVPSPHLDRSVPGLFKPKDIAQQKGLQHDRLANAAKQLDTGHVQEGCLEQLKMELQRKLDLMGKFKAGEYVLCDHGLRLKAQISELREKITDQGGSVEVAAESSLDADTPDEAPTPLKLLITHRDPNTNPDPPPTQGGKCGCLSADSGSNGGVGVPGVAITMQSEVVQGGKNREEGAESKRIVLAPGEDDCLFPTCPSPPLPPPPPPPPSPLPLPPPPPPTIPGGIEIVDLMEDEQDTDGGLDEGDSRGPPVERRSGKGIKANNRRKREEHGSEGSLGTHLWGGKSWTIKDAEGDLQGSFNLDGLREMCREGKINTSTIVFQPFLGHLAFGTVCPDQENAPVPSSKMECKALPPGGDSVGPAKPRDPVKPAENLWDVPLGQSMVNPCSPSGFSVVSTPAPCEEPDDGSMDMDMSLDDAPAVNDQRFAERTPSGTPPRPHSLMGCGLHTARRAGTVSISPRFHSAVGTPSKGKLWPRDESLPLIGGCPSQQLNSGLIKSEERDWRLPSDRGVSEGNDVGQWWLPMHVGKEGPWSMSDLRFLHTTGQILGNSLCRSKDGVMMQLEVLFQSIENSPKKDLQQLGGLVGRSTSVKHPLAVQKSDPRQPASNIADKILGGSPPGQITLVPDASMTPPPVIQNHDQVQPHSLWRPTYPASQPAPPHGAVSQPSIQHQFFPAVVTTPNTMINPCTHSLVIPGAITPPVMQPQITQSILQTPLGGLTGQAIHQQTSTSIQMMPPSGAMAGSVMQPHINQPFQLGLPGPRPGNAQVRPVMVVETGSSAPGVPKHIVVVQPSAPQTVRLMTTQMAPPSVPPHMPNLIQGFCSSGHQLGMPGGHHLGMSGGGFQGMGGGVPMQTVGRPPEFKGRAQGGARWQYRK
ncbi:hypothetical protein BSKO_09003 [Bryopsis sp. KO-2023]|nr:hypothetical protein BSKO_09003 [Bryopsis sp. KO-2023]